MRATSAADAGRSGRRGAPPTSPTWDSAAFTPGTPIVPTISLASGKSRACNVAAAARYARTLPAGSTVVTILCDGGDRYRSRLYDAAWLQENDVVPAATDLSFL